MKIMAREGINVFVLVCGIDSPSVSKIVQHNRTLLLVSARIWDGCVWLADGLPPPSGLGTEVPSLWCRNLKVCIRERERYWIKAV